MTPTPTVEIAGRRRSAVLEAIIDTGFDGDISIPVRVATALGLELVGTELFELADGSQKEELVFAGRARMAGKSSRVRMLISDSQDTLIGTRLLADCRLTVDFATQKVQIARKK
jgi:clan AA aspartic protease